MTETRLEASSLSCWQSCFDNLVQCYYTGSTVQNIDHLPIIFIDYYKYTQISKQLYSWDIFKLTLLCKKTMGFNSQQNCNLNVKILEKEYRYG